MFIGLIYCYFTFLVSPLDAEKAAAQKEIETLQADTLAGKGTVRKLQDLQAEADKADEVLAQIESMIPEGAPVAWFPPKIKNFFEQHGITDINITKTAENRFDTAALDRFRKMTWVVEIPKANFVNFAIATAGLENSFPLVKISALKIDAIEESPEQSIELTLISVFKP